jgi:hypothetical protein
VPPTAPCTNVLPRCGQARLIFESLDTDKSGALDADELLAAITHLKGADLDAEAINALIREVDLNGDGVIQPDEFAALLVAPPPPPTEHQPHLVLNFDVNQTVMILDTVIKAEPVALLNTIMSNCCWGTLTPGEGEAPPTWTLVSTEPSLAAPSAGLKTYLQYAVALTPIPKGAPLEDVKKAKAERRTLIQSFTLEGQLGAPLNPFVAKLEASLAVPAEVRGLVQFGPTLTPRAMVWTHAMSSSPRHAICFRPASLLRCLLLPRGRAAELLRCAAALLELLSALLGRTAWLRPARPADA